MPMLPLESFLGRKKLCEYFWFPMRLKMTVTDQSVTFMEITAIPHRTSYPCLIFLAVYAMNGKSVIHRTRIQCLFCTRVQSD